MALGLALLVVWILTFAGSLVGVTVVATAGIAVRDQLTRNRSAATRTRQLYRIWVTSGVTGWGLMSFLVMAPPLRTAAGRLLGAPKRTLLAWMSAGIALWTTILVIAGTVGMGLIHAIH